MPSRCRCSEKLNGRVVGVIMLEKNILLILGFSVCDKARRTHADSSVYASHAFTTSLLQETQWTSGRSYGTQRVKRGVVERRVKADLK